MMSFGEKGGLPTAQPSLTLLLENPKLFCVKCGTSEVFSPVWYYDLTNELRHWLSSLSFPWRRWFAKPLSDEPHWAPATECIPLTHLI